MKNRESAVAGGFYPSNKDELSQMVGKFLSGNNRGIENVHGVIVPHAGYKYSGAIAGRAFSHIIGKQFHKVIIICPNHTLFLDKVAIDTNDTWKTPLGEVHVDKESIEKLNKNIFIQSELSHLNEHAIEVQLPFLQKTLVNFKIIPLVVGSLHGNAISEAADEILKIMTHDTLLVISTDLSHHMTEKMASVQDAKTIKNIISLDTKNELNACGASSLKVFQVMAKKRKWQPHFIEYSNSAKTTGDKSKVVGYASFWF